MTMTTRYVSAAGAGAHDGTSEANAYSQAEMVTAINGGACAGYTYELKQGGSWSGGLSLASQSGNATSPCRLRGYKTTPGDGYLGRSSGGALNTSNMPAISFGAARLYAPNAGYLFEAMNIDANYGGPAATIGGDSCFRNCRLVNSSTNGSAMAMELNNYGQCHNCDLALTGASGGDCVVDAFGTACRLIGCRLFQSQTMNLRIGSNGSLALLNTLYGHVGVGITVANAAHAPGIFFNTIYGGTDGISVPAGASIMQMILGNHITDLSGYGINMNGSTGFIVQDWNRFRDCALGNISGATDWNACCGFSNVTVDAGGHATDFVGAGSGNFQLVAAAAAIAAALAYRIDIGANGHAAGGGGTRVYAA